MCVIVDANVASAVFSDDEEHNFRPLLVWLFHGDGMLVAGGKNKGELFVVGRARDAVVELYRAGRAYLHPDQAVDGEAQRLADDDGLRSNDEHVVALARLTGARTLCTEDEDLIRDFTNRRIVPAPRGRVYKNRTYRKLGLSRLLSHTPGCPGYRA